MELGQFGTFKFKLNGKRPGYCWGDYWTVEGCELIEITDNRLILKDAEGIIYRPKVEDMKEFKATKRK